MLDMAQSDGLQWQQQSEVILALKAYQKALGSQRDQRPVDLSTHRLFFGLRPTSDTTTPTASGPWCTTNFFRHHLQLNHEAAPYQDRYVEDFVDVLPKAELSVFDATHPIQEDALRGDAMRR
jgi:hypothetical protein